MTIDFYFFPPQPSSRSVQLVAETIGVPLNKKFTDIDNDEEEMPEYTALNPLQTVPMIVDNDTGIILWESRSIMTYLVDQYAPDHHLYPKDAIKRALVDKFLFFASEAVRPVSASTCYDNFGDKLFKDHDVSRFNEMIAMFDELLVKHGTRFVAGDQLTIADIALVVSIDWPVNLTAASVDSNKNVSEWFACVKESLPGYEENLKSSLSLFKSYLASDDQSSTDSSEDEALEEEVLNTLEALTGQDLKKGGKDKKPDMRKVVKVRMYASKWTKAVGKTQ